MDVSNLAFLGLPRELRDHIYSFCFEDGCYGFQSHEMYFEVRLGQVQSSPWHTLLRWILSSKQLMNEAMEQFHREAACAYVSFKRNDHEKCATGFLKLDCLSNVHATYYVHFSRKSLEGRRYEAKLSPFHERRAPEPRSLVGSLLTHGCKAQALTICLVTPNIKKRNLYFKDGDHDYVGASFWDSTATSFHSDKLHFVIREPLISIQYSRDHSLSSTVIRMLQYRESTYSFLQREVKTMAISMVTTAAGGKDKDSVAYAARDWLDRERFDNLTGEGTRHDWHLEVSRTEAGKDDGFRHVGMQTFRIDDPVRNDDDGLFLWGNREDGEDGLVTWRSPVYKAVHIKRAEWLRYAVGSGTAERNVRTIDGPIPEDADLPEW